MNKSIYVKDINTLLKQYRPGRFEPEYHEWMQNSDILLLQAILRDNTSSELRKVSIDRIDALFENRWQEIAGGIACYLGDRPQTATNKFFIALAQHFAKLFPERHSHYYKLLMPTSPNLDGEFATTLIPVIETPLQDMFVADDHALMCISDTIEYAKNYNHLTKVESKAHPPLTLTEKEQLLRDKNARDLAMKFVYPPKESEIVNINSETADHIRLLGIACLHGKGDVSNQAIGHFFKHTHSLSAEEKAALDAYENFKGVFDKFIAEGICIYYAGNFFCTIAFDFIREDEQWDKFLPYMPHHEEAAFDKPVRDQIKARRPLKYCRDVYEKIDVTALKAEATIDERQARAELVIIKTYIEQKAWNTFGTKTSTITLADRSSKIVPSALKPIHDALVQNNASPITLLLLIKQRFQQRYFAQANCKNTELLAFFRSFYTNNHITYMQENLHPPEQQPNLNTIPLMEIN